MHFRRSLVLALSLCLSLILSSCQLLGACQEWEVSFPDDPRILQGSWQGVVKDYPAEGLETKLQLELSATYESTSRYDISGTFKLGDEAALPFKGDVTAGCFETYRQAPGIGGGEGVIETAFMIPRPPPTELFARIGSEDEERWTVHASWSKQESPGIGRLSGWMTGRSNQALFTFNVERSSGN